MGFKMDDVHAPTVVSGDASSTNKIHNDSPDNVNLLHLVRDRDRMESELWALGSVLESHGVNMTTQLTTFDGFPRSDIDVAQIRTIRSKIIRLRNDYKSLTDRIENGLHNHFANGNAADGSSGSQEITSNMLGSRSLRENVSASELPFAKINGVSPGSPAEHAGLKQGDLVKSFGMVSSNSTEKLRKISELVAQNEETAISITVSRFDPATGQMCDVSLTLIPRRNWGGRGTLGCHLIPLQ